MKLLDLAAALIPARVIKDAGFDGVIGYLSPPRPGAEWMRGKPLTPEYCDELRAAGLHIVGNWQLGKPGGTLPSDYTTGFAGGVRHAQAALAQAQRCGMPKNRPLFFTVDEGIDERTWSEEAKPWFEGVNSVIGVANTGVYGSADVCNWAVRDGVVGQARNGRHWCWQTKAWSGNRISEHAVLYQRIVDTESNPGPVVGAFRVDVNDVLDAEDFGQWGSTLDSKPSEPEVPQMDRGPWTGDPVWLKDVLALWGVPILETEDWRTDGHGDFREVRGVIGHHTAGGGVNDWQIVKFGRPGLDGPLAQIVLEKDGTARLIAVGVCWHAGSGSGSAWANKFTTDGNWYTLGIEAVSRGTPPWDWTEVQLRNYKRIVAAILWRIGKDASWFCGHREYNLVDGKIDPAGIDLNQFRAEVQRLIDAGPSGTPAPLPAGKTGIENCWDANTWLGNKIMKERELTCPDGVGRYAHYQNGSIYWTPTLGAHPVPKVLFDFWASVGWETSWLGYPIGDPHTTAAGVWQDFQGGGLYAKNGARAWPCHGGIRGYWLSHGGIDGEYGWPTSRETEAEPGQVYQTFEKGQIVWRHAMGPVGVVAVGGQDKLGGTS